MVKTLDSQRHQREEKLEVENKLKSQVLNGVEAFVLSSLFFTAHNYIVHVGFVTSELKKKSAK